MSDTVNSTSPLVEDYKSRPAGTLRLTGVGRSHCKCSYSLSPASQMRTNGEVQQDLVLKLKYQANLGYSTTKLLSLF
jgi:hypothetical protein